MFTTNRLADKLAILSTLSSQQTYCIDASYFMGYKPLDMLHLFKEIIGEKQTDMIGFGFSDAALLQILADEFEVNTEGKTLLFRKTSLDTHSIRVAGIKHADLAYRPDTRDSQLIGELAQWLFDATRELYKDDLRSDKVDDTLAEYSEVLRQYLYKRASNQQSPTEILTNLVTSAQDMVKFCNVMTADAMFKYDAASLLFGEDAAYPQAWFRKYVFRHMIAKSVTAFIQQYQLPSIEAC